jgi:hypothetical protein
VLGVKVDFDALSGLLRLGAFAVHVDGKESVIGEERLLPFRIAAIGADLIELQAPEGAAEHPLMEIKPEWGRQWPADEIWKARKKPNPTTSDIGGL